jgi:hypothetical protein
VKTLDNPQYLIFNENRELLEQPRTIICTGVGRSGTSGVTSLIEYLGVWVGVPDYSRNRENKQLIRALNEGAEAASALISEYNQHYPVWGFKAPGLRKGLKQTLEMFRNPLIIVPHRDVVGRLSRQVVSGGRQLTFNTFRDSVMQQRRLLDELDRVPAPQLHLSFSLVTSAPEEALSAISAFTGLPIPEGELQAYMESSRERYLRPLDKEAKKAAKR